jgi:hypothetical protein
MAWRCQSVAQTAHLVEYLGTAEANLGWVHLQEGRREEGETLCRAALARWLGRPLAHPFEWLARLPLLTLAGDAPPEETREHLRALLAPSQQRLPEALAEALARTRDAEADAEPLAHALDVAQQLGFV